MHALTSPGFVFLVVVAVWLAAGAVLRGRSPRWHWYIVGYPRTWLRISWSWRPLCIERGLGVSRTAGRAMIGDLKVSGQDLRPVVPRIWIGLPTATGLTVRVRLLPGQTPELYAQASTALMHAWRVHSVRVTSPNRGLVLIQVFTSDPLAGVVVRDIAHAPVPAEGRPPDRAVLSLLVGVTELANSWLVNLRVVPHWLIVGATRSGKSTLIHAIVVRLADQAVALVGVDLKGGLELAAYRPRLSGLATTRQEAADLLAAVLQLALDRMEACKVAGVRAVWELPDPLPPIIVLIDEVAELYLVTNPRDREEQALRDQTAVTLLRLAQLGAALDVYLIVGAQRFGAELGQLVTSLRAQLTGRVCMHVSDKETALMTLGDLWPEAVATAQLIGVADRGIAVAADGDGGWVRVRAVLTSVEEAAAVAMATAQLTPVLPGIDRPWSAAGGEE